MTPQEIEALRDRLEARGAREIGAAMTAQGEAIAEAIEAEDFPVFAFVEDTVAAAIIDLWRATITTFATRTARSIEERYAKTDDWLEIVTRFLETEGAKLIEDIFGTTREVVRAIIEQGVQDGDTVREIAARLRTDWPELSRIRSERIARTEVMRASNYGSVEGARDIAERAGLELQKVWYAAIDDRTRESHVYMHGEPAPLDGVFILNGIPCQYPGDSSLPAAETINCRCTMLYEPVAQKAWHAERNERIRKEYPPLRDRMGYVQAMEELGDREGLSFGQIKRIVYSG
jgi:SPP1 gp7 family putative phage head morphogenesis protein